MKKAALLFAIIFISYCASAQVSKSLFPNDQKRSASSYADKYHMLKLMHDNRLAIQKLLAKDTLPNLDNMPVAGNIAASEYIGNNKRGFDVLLSPLDNMVIAKPDNSFVSNMPVKISNCYNKTVAKF